MVSELKELFEDERLLGRYLPGYEFRPNQLKMSEGIFEAFSDNDNLIIEAPSGTGKSFAYLTAAEAYNFKTRTKIVISTYTKTLQNQLYYKDLPLLESIIGRKINYALSIGSNNYLCRRRLNVFLKTGGFNSFPERKDLFLSWVDETRTGLFTDVDVYIPPSLRSKVNRDRQTCLGAKCPYADGCFYLRSRRKLKRSDIIIANHSMVFTDITSGADILPSEYILVLDEAHTAEEVARDKFSDEVSTYTIRKYIERLFEYLQEMDTDDLFSDIRKSAGQLRKNLKELDGLLEVFYEEAENVIPVTGNIVLEESSYDMGAVYSRLEVNAQLLDEMFSSGTERELEDFMPEMFLLWTNDLMRLVREIFWQDKKSTRVYWQGARNIGKRKEFHFHSTVLDVAEDLDRCLFSSELSRVLTSATMTTSSSREDPFSYIIGTLGLKGPRKLRLPDVFDYGKNVYFCIPSQMTDPKKNYHKYRNQTVQYIIKTYDVVQGGVFVLFTSYSMLNYCSMRLKDQRPEIEVLKQGDLPRYVLLDVFKSQKDKTVLLGTTSFWQGVDVSGDALQAVVITRLPFSVPTDPVVKMRMEYLSRAGRNAFMEYQLPKALIMFKQGFGRLIRNQNDKGIVVVLDSRISTRRYGRHFLEILPDMKINRRFDGFKDFLEEQNIDG